MRSGGSSASKGHSSLLGHPLRKYMATSKSVSPPFPLPAGVLGGPERVQHQPRATQALPGLRTDAGEAPGITPAMRSRAASLPPQGVEGGYRLSSRRRPGGDSFRAPRALPQRLRSAPPSLLVCDVGGACKSERQNERRRGRARALALALAPQQAGQLGRNRLRVRTSARH